MQVKAQRRRQFDKRNNFYRQDKVLRTDVKMLYQKLGKKQVKTKEASPKDGVEEFWK